MLRKTQRHYFEKVNTSVLYFNFRYCKMTEENDTLAATNEGTDNAVFLPQDSRRVATVLLWFLAFSLAMFSLPFIAFFGTQHILKDKFNVDGFQNTVWSVVVSVATVNIIIIAYACKGYYEVEYDEYGNVIDQGQCPTKRDSLNIKED